MKTSPGLLPAGRGTPARRRVLPYAAAAAGVYLHLEARSFRHCTTTTTDDPRIAVMVTCSHALSTAYRALLVLLVLGSRRHRTHRKGETHV